MSIQELAGHKNMQTTLRHMHLAPGGPTERFAYQMTDKTQLKKAM